MSQGKAADKLAKVTRSLDEIRETLFDCSREYVTTEGDDKWPTADALFNLAKSVDLLRRQITSLLNNSNMPPAVTSSIVENTLANTEKVSTKPTRKKKEDYPKFTISNNSLIKTGLGRDKRTEYEQIVPKTELEKIIMRLSSMTTSCSEFNAENVQEGLECPMYQTYTVLSLLRQMGFLDLPRRGTYSFHSPKTFPMDAKAIWSQIRTNAQV